MLADMIAEFGRRVVAGENMQSSSLWLEIRLMEAEARNMEERLEHLTGRPHVPLGGTFIAGPVIEIGGKRDA